MKSKKKKGMKHKEINKIEFYVKNKYHFYAMAKEKVVTNYHPHKLRQ